MREKEKMANLCQNYALRSQGNGRVDENCQLKLSHTDDKPRS